jgi:excisionase family DNA binding protein
MKATSVLQVMTEIRNLLLHQKDIFTVSEVCSYTGFEKSYIYKLTSTKKIPHFKSPGGKNVFFKREEINDWLTQIRVKTVDEINSEAERLKKDFKTKK